MPVPREMYDVSIWLEAGDDPSAAAQALVDALGDVAPSEARGVRVEDQGVVVDFPDMQAREGQQLGHVGLSREGLDRILPVLEAMISVSTARVRAGLAPTERVVIDVRSSGTHAQEELRHS